MLNKAADTSRKCNLEIGGTKSDISGNTNFSCHLHNLSLMFKVAQQPTMFPVNTFMLERDCKANSK